MDIAKTNLARAAKVSGLQPPRLAASPSGPTFLWPGLDPLTKLLSGLHPWATVL